MSEYLTGKRAGRPGNCPEAQTTAQGLPRPLPPPAPPALLLSLCLTRELQGRQGPSGSLGRRGPRVFAATLALMGEWEIEDQPAPLGAQETKGTPEKTGSL